VADERIKAELILENSAFIAAMNASELETSEFIKALNLFDADGKRASQSTRSLTEELRRLTVEEIKLVEVEKQASSALQAETAQTQAATAAKKGLATATDAATASKRQFGSTVLYASYAVQDFTSQLGTRGLAGAFGAIQNNIPQVLIGLGAGAGFTGIASVAAVAAGVLAEKLMKTNEQITESTKKLQEQAEAAKKAVDAMQVKADPGTAGSVARQGATIDQVFAGTQMGGIRKGVLSRILGGAGGSDMTRQEQEDETKLQGELSGFDAATDEQIRALPVQFQNKFMSDKVRADRETERAALNDRLQALQQSVAERRTNRLLQDAVKPGKAGEKARRELANMANGAPNGTFPPQFAERLRDLNSQDNRTAQQAMDQFGLESDIEQMQIEQGINAENQRKWGRHSVGPDAIRQRNPRNQWGFGYEPEDVEKANRAGVTGGRFGGMTPAEWRKRQQAAAERPVNPNAPNSDQNVAPGLVAQQQQILQAMGQGLVAQAEGLAGIKELQGQINILKREQERMVRGFRDARRTQQMNGGN